MSNARSPRDVCSITIGISGLISGSPGSSRRLLSASRSPYLHVAGGLLLLGGPQLLAGSRKVHRDALHSGDDVVEGLLEPQIAPQLLEAAVLPHGRDGLVRVVPGRSSLLADQLLDLPVRDVDGELD